jgi:hypothetical protein
VVSRAKAGLFISQDSITPTLKQMPGFVDKAIGAVTKSLEAPVYSAARLNAPWTDQTGNARAGLLARAKRESQGVHSITLFHRVPYGIWLEVANGQQFAVVLKTIRKFGPIAMARLTGLLNKVTPR